MQRVRAQNTNSAQSEEDSLGVVGKGMLKNNALLSVVLQRDIQRWYPWSYVTHRRQQSRPTAFIGWGRKKSFRRAGKAANRLDVPVLSVEDGFLRSLDSGIASRHGLSVVVDDIGIYFDMTAASRLEALIIERQHNWTPEHERQALDWMARIKSERLSKYNAVWSSPCLSGLNGLNNNDRVFDHSKQAVIKKAIHPSSSKGFSFKPNFFKLSSFPPLSSKLPLYQQVSSLKSVGLFKPSHTANQAAHEDISLTSKTLASTSLEHVLLIDQVQGDASIVGAGANKRQFKRMLKTACRRHPNAQIWIKAHPAGKKGYLTTLRLPERVKILREAANPIALFQFQL